MYFSTSDKLLRAFSSTRRTLDTANTPELIMYHLLPLGVHKEQGVVPESIDIDLAEMGIDQFELAKGTSLCNSCNPFVTRTFSAYKPVARKLVVVM